MTGFGTAGFGTCVYGYGTPDDPTSVPTGNTSACAYLDPITKDYSVDATSGHLKQVPRVMQQAILALMTEFGSATAAETFGYDGPNTMTRTFEAEVEAAARAALRHLTHVQKVMRIDRIEVERSPGRYAINLFYTNLETGAAEDIEIVSV